MTVLISAFFQNGAASLVNPCNTIFCISMERLRSKDSLSFYLAPRTECCFVINGSLLEKEKREDSVVQTFNTVFCKWQGWILVSIERKKERKWELDYQEMKLLLYFISWMKVWKLPSALRWRIHSSASWIEG